MKAERCPVCSGNGLVPNGFYSQTTGVWTSGSTAPETCRGCDGKGWVAVPEDEVTFNFGSNELNINKCPSCRRHKDEPPLTSCPAGGHYGTY